MAEAAGVKVLSVLGHTLFDSAAIMAANKGKPPITYGPFVKIVEKLPAPAEPLPVPKQLPDPLPNLHLPPDMRREDHSVEPYKANDVNFPVRLSEDDAIYDTFAGPNKDFAVPTFAELNLKPATSSHRGGEKRALGILDLWITEKKSAILAFEKPKTNPGAFAPPETTTLSPHLKFGTLSCRKFYHELQSVVKGKSHTKPPVSLIGQLYWREFFHCCNAGIANFQQMKGNPECRFMDWRLQNRYDADNRPIPMHKWPADDRDEEAEKLL